MTTPNNKSEKYPGLAKANAGKPLTLKPTSVLITEILDKYESGLTMMQVAQSYGLARADQIYRLLLAESPDKWREYQAARSLRRLEDATADLEQAGDAISVSQSRERVKAAQWELEKLMRRLYGQDQPSNVAGNIQINIGISRDK